MADDQNGREDPELAALAAGCEVDGFVVDNICGRNSRQVVVYTTRARIAGEHIGVRYRVAHGYDLTPCQERALQAFNDRYDQVAFVPPNRRDKALEKLGTALFAALMTPDETQHDDAFAGIDVEVRRHFVAHTRLLYLSGAVVSLVALLAVDLPLLLLLNLPAAIPYALVALLGGAGAFASVVARQHDNEYFSARLMFVSGMSRVVLGAIFGEFLAVAVFGNIALGFLASSLPAMCFAAAVAGFSERFVPDLIESFERNARASVTQAGKQRLPIAPPKQ